MSTVGLGQEKLDVSDVANSKTLSEHVLFTEPSGSPRKESTALFACLQELTGPRRAERHKGAAGGVAEQITSSCVEGKTDIGEGARKASRVRSCPSLFLHFEVGGIAVIGTAG